jgi:hypothetical protein
MFEKLTTLFDSRVDHRIKWTNHKDTVLTHVYVRTSERRKWDNAQDQVHHFGGTVSLFPSHIL